MDVPEITDLPHLGQVVPAVLGALGVPGEDGSLALPEARSACVLLIDGLGWQLLAEHAADAPVLTELAKSPLRVGFPSTTAAGVAAIGTGLASGEHGMVGYTFEVPGAGVLNALRWRSHDDGSDLRGALPPRDVQPLPTTFERAVAAGIEAAVVSSAQFADTALTRATQSGARYAGVHALGDLAARTLDVLASRAFCYAYHSELDLLGHLYGPGSPAWRMQLRHVDRLVESLVDGLPAGALLAVVADHGMVAVDDKLDLEDTPALLAGVRAFGGEVRARHVYAETGAEADVLAAWQEVLGSRAWVLPRDEAIARGWFGATVSDRVRPRIGDVVAAAQGTFGMVRELSEAVESSLIGQHGSLTEAEQLVPLALAHG
ncbi:alkaline phosphatase family protein [Amycolatopsis sp. FDAARGOS 1241]|uniref:alkaline phosphatase family protein n=1 Tax=Amycolatopsis sp. FDAARGOS 1241 TaxID=2778070 RepID=UPI00194F09EC|nr:nucleotide pyrophosphatase/phosphodiesterase family protein [Amycolatopsis sp. FDAARGOS 1241]QRP47489.1 alkaline phosphatase family protein [Amycolatopsis sp. FDAARGOS 1241]